MAHAFLRIPDEKAYDGYVDLHYEDVGSGAPAMVFIHGLGADHVEFDHQMEYFSALHRCVAYDQRGFGLTASEGELNIERSLEDLEFLVDTLGLERFILVGHSMGTMVSYMYADKHPERVERLIIIGGTAAIRQSPFVYLGLKALPRAGKYMAESHRRWLVRRLALDISMRSEMASPRIVEHYMGENPKMFSGEFYDACMHYMQAITDFDCRSRLGRIQCPTLIVHGALDMGISLNSALTARLALPHSSLRILPHCGHSPNVEVPDKLNRIMEKFMGKEAAKIRG